MKVKIVFKEDLTFLSIPQQKFKKGTELVGEVQRFVNSGLDFIFLPENEEMRFQIPMSAIEMKKAENE